MSLLLNLFSKKDKIKYTLVVDIGSESIGASFVLNKNDEKVAIVDTERKLIPFQDKINIKRFISLMQETLSTTLDELSARNKNIIPSSTLITLASPWHTSQTRILNINEKDNFVITESGLKEILDRESKSFKTDTPNIESSALSNNSVIESHVIELKINGYNVEKPIGRKTNNMEIFMHITTSPDIIICSLRETINKRWNASKIIFHSFMFSAYNTILEIFKDTSSFIIIDIAGEVTDIALVRNNVLLESISFPLGYRSYTRSVGRELSLDGDLALSEIKLWKSGGLDIDRASKINDIINKTTNNWSMLFEASLKQLSNSNIIPRNIYLISNEEYLDIFSNSIIDKSDEILGETQEKFKVNTLNTSLLSNYLSDNSIKYKDLFLYVTIIMLTKLLIIENNYNNQYICQKI